MKWGKVLKCIGRKMIYFNPDMDLERAGVDGLYRKLYGPEEDCKEEKKKDKKSFFEKYGAYMVCPFGPTRISYGVYIREKRKRDDYKEKEVS